LKGSLSAFDLLLIYAAQEIKPRHGGRAAKHSIFVILSEAKNLSFFDFRVNTIEERFFASFRMTT